MTNITYNDYPLHDIAREVEIPTWAYINLSKDSSFDLGVALYSAFLYLVSYQKVIL
jgi:hypothetical protein